MSLQRVIVKAFGGPEQLSIETISEPLRPGSGQLLVDVEAAGVNYLDVYQRKGLSPVSLPFTPGYEGVGRVREIGESTARNTVAVGERVAWINTRGSYASQVLVAAAEAIPVPKIFKTSEALLFQAITAEYLMTEYRTVGPGDQVLSMRQRAAWGSYSCNGASISAHGWWARFPVRPKRARFAPLARMPSSTMDMTTISSMRCCP